MSYRNSKSPAQLLCSVAGAALVMYAGAAQAQETRRIEIAPQSLATALHEFGVQSGHQVLFKATATAAKKSPGAVAEGDMELALNQLLAGTGLSFRRAGDVFLIEPEGASGPQSGSAAGGGAEVEALIVTAQKREEDIQDVPIAMSAFSQEQLERSQIAGGPDLITQVPNMTFTKTNFSSYSIQLRGIGTQAISATTDAAVAVAFNNTPFIRNRFFEQEFYDLQRVEVLRGPQGTLYGRNATAGVVNLISQKPKFGYEAKLSADVANYGSTRLEGMVNVPLVDDKVALRLAGAWTKREGFVTNELTDNPIDGRDLWSSRVSLRLAPTDAIDVNLIWEHFEEDDDRLRSGKQLCHTDVVTDVAGFPTDMNSMLNSVVQQAWSGVQGTFSEGCAPASLYSPDSFETPNGIALPYVLPLASVGVPVGPSYAGTIFDAYASRTQSRDLRVIESTVDPRYQADADVVELQFSADVSDGLILTSETGYNVDSIFSTQDFNRFNTASGVFRQPEDGLQVGGFFRQGLLQHGPNGGIFCDPQVGCSDRLVAVDLSTARSRQFSEELRLASDFDGPFNFSLGANFLRYDTEDKYYVFINTVGLFAALSPYSSIYNTGTRGDLPPYQPGVTDNLECMGLGTSEPDATVTQTINGCIYVDPNPIGQLNDRGHNYFLSRNPYKLISYAIFGESYYNITDNLKLTAGLRWTVDKKEAPRHPSWLLASDTVGYPAAEVVEQEWREPTGRVTLDWKPDLSLTDETLLYASYAHGYKAGGMNPPPAGVVCYFTCNDLSRAQDWIEANHPRSFAPEFIDAFELGAKNTLLDGKLTLNTAAFYYDYEGYQISQIMNRAAINSNFDASVWGLEVEADWRPLENLRLGFKGGYEKTRVADGMKAIDVRDRTNGDPNWIAVRPFPTFPSNCIVPVNLFVGDYVFEPGHLSLVDVGGRGFGAAGPCELAYVLGVDPITGLAYKPDPTEGHPFYSTLGFHPGYAGWDPDTAPNHGAGFDKDLSGNELPNAPHYTATITGDYTIPLPHDWLATLHTDLYYQSEAWTRIFNTEGYDKLKAHTNVNLAAIFTNEDAGWKVMAYVKNVFDKDNITGAFLNSDDTGLTTNVFLNEPRLYGLRVTKDWSGGPWWTGASADHTGPYPLTIELGGQVLRNDAPYELLTVATFAGADPRLVATSAVQNRGLDWGDGRSVKLTWRPAGRAVFAALEARNGRANSDTGREHREVTNHFKACRFHPGTFEFGYVCDPAGPLYGAPQYESLRSLDKTEWSDAGAHQREEYNTLEFSVGRDMGLGAPLTRSEVSLGVRRAELDSTTNLEASALMDWSIPDGWGFSQLDPIPSTYNGYRVNLTALREFSGVGPVISWAAQAPLIGNDATGRINMDWKVTLGALFGDQETSVGGQEQVTVYSGVVLVFPGQQQGSPAITEPPAARSRSVTVPLADLSLGLSYVIGRVNVGAGYRWERYFDALDAGYGEHKDADRTIDGPYFKIAVGFGG